MPPADQLETSDANETGHGRNRGSAREAASGARHQEAASGRRCVPIDEKPEPRPRPSLPERRREKTARSTDEAQPGRTPRDDGRATGKPTTDSGSQSCRAMAATDSRRSPRIAAKTYGGNASGKPRHDHYHSAVATRCVSARLPASAPANRPRPPPYSRESVGLGTLRGRSTDPLDALFEGPQAFFSGQPSLTQTGQGPRATTRWSVTLCRSKAAARCADPPVNLQQPANPAARTGGRAPGSSRRRSLSIAGNEPGNGLHLSQAILTPHLPLRYSLCDGQQPDPAWRYEQREGRQLGGHTYEKGNGIRTA